MDNMENKRKDLSIQEKYEFLLAYEQNQRFSMVIQIAEDFGIKKSQHNKQQ